MVDCLVLAEGVARSRLISPLLSCYLLSADRTQGVSVAEPRLVLTSTTLSQRKSPIRSACALNKYSIHSAAHSQLSNPLSQNSHHLAGSASRNGLAPVVWVGVA